MTAEERYSTAASFRRALTDRLRVVSKESRWSLPQLQRQIAYDRLLQRLYQVSDDWVVKGATALLARDLVARGSLDVDVYREAEQDVAEADLRRAVGIGAGDWFSFEVGESILIGNAGVRLPIDARIGATTWAAFHVDLVGSDIRMTGEPESVPPLIAGAVPGIPQAGYKAYPLVDHVADKVAATYERHGESQRSSARFRDLVDLVSIVTGASIPADRQGPALLSEFRRRKLALPRFFEAPDRLLWRRGYDAEATRSILTVGRSLDEAPAIVKPFIDPLFDGTASGTWDHERRLWSGDCRI